MKKLILLTIVLLALLCSFGAENVKLNFEKIDGKYIVWQQLNGNQIVAENYYLCDKKIISVLRYFDVGVPQEKLQAAFLRPGDEIFVRSDSAYNYQADDYYLKKSKIVAQQFIAYDPELKAIVNRYDTENYYDLPAWNIIFLFTAGLIAALVFGFLINHKCELSGPYFFSFAFAFYVAAINWPDKDWESIVLHIIMAIIFSLIPAFLTLFGLLFSTDPLNNNYRDPGNRFGKRLGAILLSIAVLMFSLQLAITSQFYIGTLISAALIFGGEIIATSIAALCVYGVRKIFAK